jgi:oxygen-independent coproporphyrinogen-3 oxidase
MHLYLHVPFCRKKCAYCGFASAPGSPDDMSAYVRTLIQEMMQRAAQVEGRPIRSVYLGGGTPSLLPAHELERIFSAAKRFFAWSEDAEICLEANPDSVHSEDQVRAWRNLGVTRVSLGVQSLDREVLCFLGRSHTPEQIDSAVQYLKGAEVDNFGLDLIWGIPGQDLGSWLETLREVLAWNPAHLSLYSLSVEPGTPLAAMEAGQDRIFWQGQDKFPEYTSREFIHNDGSLAWPDEDTWSDMFIQGRKLLVQAGFEHYEISNYARPGYKCRHNRGIWQGEDYMGLGPAAVSTLNAVRRQNPDNLPEYIGMMDHGDPLPAVELLPLQVQERENGMLGLRTNQGVDLAWTESWLDRDLAARLQEKGLLEVQRGRLRLTPRGMLVSNEILARLL